MEEEINKDSREHPCKDEGRSLRASTIQESFNPLLDKTEPLFGSPKDV